MATLTGTERSRLEKATLAARNAAEAGVRKRFDALDLTSDRAPANPADRPLRNALRKRARDLGRGRIDPAADAVSAMEKGLPFLVEELAYETWHRMLFARVLAENNLLTHPEFGVALSIDDVKALAAHDDRDPWDLASEFAADRLPGLFHLSIPLRLTSEDRQALSAILNGMEPALFTASDALGWGYQFWQAKRKDEVNASGEKINGNTLSPVTQLFTEDYIVDFLLQNSLGAWYVARNPATALRHDWPFLRFREDGTPAAGTFPTWPESVAEITVMDPCCGSGHFLVAAFQMLTAMRQEAEGLSASEAADAVLRDNLYGLELDARCTQIATFAVALEAWKRGGHPEANLPHIACSGIPVSGQEKDWQRLAGGDDNLRIALEQLYDLFSKASELGSLIDPKRATLMARNGKGGQRGLVLLHEWDAVERRLLLALEREHSTDPAARVFADDDLVGTVRAARLLSGTYTLVATNVPYLARGKQSPTLTRFADDQHSNTKTDLATMFIERIESLTSPGGSYSLVTPHSWLFLGSFGKFRSALLQTQQIDLISLLGARAFQTITGEVVAVLLGIFTNQPAAASHKIRWLDVSDEKGAVQKRDRLSTAAISESNQWDQLVNPDARITVRSGDLGALLGKLAEGLHGQGTFDDPCYVFRFWEVREVGNGWVPQQTTSTSDDLFGGAFNALRWEDGEGMLARSMQQRAEGGYTSGKWRAGIKAWGKGGVAIGGMGRLYVSAYLGTSFNENLAVVLPKDQSHLPAILAYCRSPQFAADVRAIDRKPKVTCNTFVKVPFDLEHWQKVAEERYPDGLPEPYSSDPTQWLFKGMVIDADQPLQVAMARLLGYRWPDQVDDGLDALSDPDGIVCLPSVYQEPAADSRLRDLLARAYGDAWNEAKLRELLEQVGASSLEGWLRDRNAKTGFFGQHVSLFQNRPFLWLISDGRRDGFAAVVNYHKLTNGTLNKLIYTYLGEWISRQERGVAAGEAGAQGRLEDAAKLRDNLIKILHGETGYDIYVRWKSLAEQPIGWNPDLNDGVRLNIRPFITAGVLAGKVNVKWEKDRGNDPAVRSEPLAVGADRDLKERIERHCSTVRYNDLHFSLEEKRRARELAKQAGDA